MNRPGVLLSLALLFPSLTHCGGSAQGPAPPPKVETSADEILRIGTTWVNVELQKEILSPPSPISMSSTRRESEITFAEGAASEHLIIRENLELRSGGTIECETQFTHSLSLRWGRKQGQAAVELVRPALSGPRSCTGVHPDGDISEDSRPALFVLRSDNLVAVEPLVDQRSYAEGRL